MDELVLDQPLFARRKLRMVAIGAGFANLTLAYKHKYEGDNSFIDLVVYEKNPDIGGTWYENIYPGVACDVPSHIYTFPFSPNPDWSQFYASGPEILEYMRKTVDQFQLGPYVQVSSRVVSAVWSEDKGKWDLQIERNGQIVKDEADILVNGTGFLNKWKWPDIPGRERYQGQLVHSARWDPELKWDGKRVALIGNGSSAIQILPQLQKTAKSVDAYIRTPTWIIPNMLAEFTPEGKNFSYTEQEKARFREHPEELRDMRRKMEHTFNEFFKLFLKDSPQQAAVRSIFTDMMKAKLGADADLVDRLIPDWPVGCRRITPGDGYLEALTADNVKPRFDKIVEFTEKGLVTEPMADTGGPESSEYDIVVAATGFDVTCVPAWEMKGANGTDLQEMWKDDAEAYLGISAPDMPNYFIFCGPNAPVGHGSLLGVLDATADYILKWSAKIASEGIKSILVKPDVMREHNDWTQAFLSKTVWSSNCRSWYKRGKADGKVTAMYAGSVLHYREMLSSLRVEDHDISYWNKRNRFTFLGNGLTRLEMEGGDLGYYLEK